MLSTHVSELTVDELKALVRETVQQTLAELLADPDSGLELRESMKAAVRRSNKELREGSKLYSMHQIDRDNQKIPVQENKLSFNATIKEGMIKLPEEYVDRIGQNVQVISVLRRGKIAAPTLIDRLLANPARFKDFHPMSRNEIHAR
jgi:hypothetical protein